MAMALEKQLKELQDTHKKAEYQSIKRIGERCYNYNFIKCLHHIMHNFSTSLYDHEMIADIDWC